MNNAPNASDLKPIFVDFETEAIGPRPLEYPPKPVGVAIFDPETDVSDYYVGDDMVTELTKAYNSGRPMVFHNAMFDLDVAETHLGLPWPERHDDTLTMAFLKDCHVDQLSLKYLAEKWCGIKPDARDELNEWILRNVPESTPKTAGAYICRAPVELVRKYAKDDVRMTAALYEHCLPAIQEQEVAYRREIALQKVLVENSRLGVRVDRHAMMDAWRQLGADIEKCEQWIRTRLNAPDLEVGSGPQMARALLASDAYDRTLEWPTTAKGSPRTDKQTVSDMVTDKALIDVMRYRSYASTIRGTYAQPWLLMSKHTGRIYTEWNAVRGERGGTRTGRLSASPSLQTAPVRYPKFEHLPPELELQELPVVRQWLLPDEGHKMVSCDFQGQELRVFAHFENGQLAEQYKIDPRADLHQFAADLMSKATGYPVSRTYSKGVSFAVLYGAGPNKISEMLEISVELARELVNAYKSSVATRLDAINAVMSKRYALGAPFTTLGGRRVKGEPAKVIMGRLRQFNYKMVNLLIQGSSADQAKQAMVDYAADPVNNPGRLLLSVHDELVVSAPADQIELAAERLAYVMCNALPMSVPMISDAKIGENYHECK